LNIYQKLVTEIERENSAKLITILESEKGELLGKKILINQQEEEFSQLEDNKLEEEIIKQALTVESEIELVKELDRVEFLVENYLPSSKLVIFGGGHITLALSQIVAGLNLEQIIVDDRVSFANQERFPTAEKIICKDYASSLKELEINPQDFVVVATRGHRYDHQVLKSLLVKPPFYIGMVSSKSRVKRLFKQLKEQSFAQADLDLISSPVGLDLGAQTPWEIGISIAAELVKIYNQELIRTNQQELDILTELVKQDNLPAALVTILATKGSTPRKAGSKMLVRADGSIVGTIGGGCNEAEAKKKALIAIDNQESAVYQLDLTSDLAAEEGMACGGIMDIFIEPIY